MTDLSWVKTKDEGQFFERKGCYDYSTGKPKLRPARDVAADIAETLAAMANADGGTLVVGFENDGVVTGVRYPDDRLEVLRRAYATHVRPQVHTRRQEVELDGHPIFVFDLDWSSEVHQLSDGRYVMRVGDANVPFPAEDIRAIKDSKRLRATEMQFIPEARLDDLDLGSVEELGSRSGRAEPPEDLLREYRLIEDRNGSSAITLAALLLFGKQPGRWHPHCDIDFVKYEGTKRGLGESLNIIKRSRMEHPLVRLIEEAYRAVEPHVRERQQLVDLFFEERLEYPSFAWQEAIVNAVAHRDYRYTGVGIEIWMFDDRVEVRSPGELVEPVTLERLRNRERVHASRNPRIARVLTDFGYMREQGEGLPRMFEAMEREGLYPPELNLEAGTIFTVTLKNTPIYGAETVRWLQQFDSLELSGNQKRILAYAREHGDRFTSRAYQSLVHVDLYTASRDIKELIRKGVVSMPQKGGRVYEVLSQPTPVTEKPVEYRAVEPILLQRGYVSNSDFRRKLRVSVEQASRIARKLVASGWLRPEGSRRTRRYVAAG